MTVQNLLIPLTDELCELLCKAVDCGLLGDIPFELRLDGLHVTVEDADEMMDRLLEDSWRYLRETIWAEWKLGI